MSGIELIDLTKRFGDLVAVGDLTLEIRDKEFVALLGPSGCGKTTTMNMIAGIEGPTAGSIRFDGRDITRTPPGRRGVGFVFQNYAIFLHMSVYKNLAFGLEVGGVERAEIDRRVRDMAKLMRLERLINWPADRLSVNELQRLAIGRSAIVKPNIFLLDEPLSNLDAAFRAEMRTELKHLQHELKQTMVYVTHDQLEAMSMADRIAVMHQGVLQQYGTPLEVYNRPANTFVAQFMGSPSMNLLRCRIAGAEDDMRLDFGATGGLRLAADDARRARCQRLTAAEAIFGFRPEDAELRPAAAAADGSGLAMTVRFVERIGARAIIHLEAGGNVVKVVGENRLAASIGQLMTVALGPGIGEFFDAASGARVA